MNITNNAQFEPCFHRLFAGRSVGVPKNFSKTIWNPFWVHWKRVWQLFVFVAFSGNIWNAVGARLWAIFRHGLRPVLGVIGAHLVHWVFLMHIKHASNALERHPRCASNIPKSASKLKFDPCNKNSANALKCTWTFTNFHSYKLQITLKSVHVMHLKAFMGFAHLPCISRPLVGITSSRFVAYYFIVII